MGRLLFLTPFVLSACVGSLDDPSAFDGEASAGGSAALSECATEPPQFFTDEMRCGGCHQAGSALGANFDLASENVESRVNGVAGQCPEEALANPADPESSTLVQWVRGTAECETAQSNMMPPIGANLSAEEIDCLLTWIDNLDGVEDM